MVHTLVVRIRLDSSQPESKEEKTELDPQKYPLIRR